MRWIDIDVIGRILRHWDQLLSKCICAIRVQCESYSIADVILHSPLAAPAAPKKLISWAAPFKLVHGSVTETADLTQTVRVSRLLLKGIIQTSMIIQDQPCRT